MAITDNPLLNNTSGKIGNTIVVKQYRYGTVISAMPNMRRVKKSELQQLKQNWFKDAVVYAQTILRDPKKKAAYAKKIKDGKTVYHTAIKEYLERAKKGEIVKG